MTETTTTTTTETLTHTTARVDGRAVEICTFRGGRTEVYCEYSDQPGLVRWAMAHQFGISWG